jgi:hypothetical protein
MYESMRALGQEVDPDAPFMPRAVPDHTTVRVNTSSVGREVRGADGARHPGRGPCVTDTDRELMLEAEFIQAWLPVTDPRLDRRQPL